MMKINQINKRSKNVISNTVLWRSYFYIYTYNDMKEETYSLLFCPVFAERRC